jgi:hypothetical protein
MNLSFAPRLAGASAVVSNSHLQRRNTANVIFYGYGLDHKAVPVPTMLSGICHIARQLQ